MGIKDKADKTKVIWTEKKIGLNLELDIVECENIIINYGERQGMGIKDDTTL
jgi:hypothetical protein